MPLRLFCEWGNIMANFLETVMLVCFGLSWPINLVKSIKARTAKATSLKFLILITVGYVAGISAKLINHQINYVLVFYILNIIVVGMNLIVYFVNKKYDREAQKRESIDSLQTVDKMG